MQPQQLSHTTPTIYVGFEQACDGIVFVLSALNTAFEGALLEAMIVGGSCLLFLVMSWLKPAKGKVKGFVNGTRCSASLKSVPKPTACKVRGSVAQPVRTKNNNINNNINKKCDEVQKLVTSIIHPGRSLKQALQGLELYRTVVEQQGIDLSKQFGDDQHARSFYIALVSCTVQAGQGTAGGIRRLLSDMRKFRFQPNIEFYSAIFKMLGNDHLWQDMLLLRSDMVTDAVEPDSAVLICFLNAAVALDDSNGALRYFHSLTQLGPPSQRTYMTVLRIYCRRKDWEGAVHLVDKMESMGSAPDTLVLNQVLGLCISVGKVKVAARLFNQWHDIRDVISCNTLLKGFTQAADLTKAEATLHQMLSEGPQPNLITFNTMMDCAFKALQSFSVKTRDQDCSAGSCSAMHGIANRPWELLDQLYSLGLEPDRYTCSTLVKGMHLTGGSSGEIDRAVALLNRLGPEVLAPPDASGASTKDSNTRLVEVIFNTLLDICTSSRDLDRMTEIFCMMQKFSVVISAVTFGTLIKAFGQAGRIQRCHEVWQEMRDAHVAPTVVTYGCYIDACLRNKDLEGAEVVFLSMSQDRLAPNAVIYTSIIRGLASGGRPVQAFAKYRQMRAAGIAPTSVTFNALVDMVSRHLAPSDVVQEILRDMIRPSAPLDVSACDLLLKATIKSGNLSNAMAVFRQVRNRSIVFDFHAFNVLLQACAKADWMLEAQEVFRDMQHLKIAPTSAVSSAVIKMYGRMKMPDMASVVLDAAECGDGEKPNIQLYTCLMQVYMSNRQARQSLKVLDRMLRRDIQPDAITYSTMMHGCIQLNKFECVMHLARHASAFHKQSFERAKQKTSRSAASEESDIVLKMMPLSKPVCLQAEIHSVITALHQKDEFNVAQELVDLMKQQQIVRSEA